ncbi:hypothetical protein [Gordonia sp. NPDC127522]|uniref:hypothetical protein n=1 Tax=Gordonia sp. NPDC127522 TaxID=3345390 RepID=UPI003639A5F5
MALLVVAPSKTDRERVVPTSADLFHVIACIIRRIIAWSSRGAAGHPVRQLRTHHQ